MIIGIPRALYYYRYYPLWSCFFSKIGVDTVVSDETTQEILDSGVTSAVDGLCLPVKVFFGHVNNLIEKNVDYLFVPHFISITRREYICPKFMGLPDMVISSIKNIPPLLSPVIDGRKTRLSIAKSFIDLGLRFAPLPKVITAYIQALHAQHHYESKMQTDINTSQPQTIGVLGHEYLIYDDYISMGTIKRLQNAGCQVITSSQVSKRVILGSLGYLAKPIFWTSAKTILGSLEYFANKVDGIIVLTSFACGPDSLTYDIASRYCHHNHIPYLQLSLDEHTGEAGVITRVEAFIELLNRRKRHEINRATYG